MKAESDLQVLDRMKDVIIDLVKLVYDQQAVLEQLQAAEVFEREIDRVTKEAYTITGVEI